MPNYKWRIVQENGWYARKYEVTDTTFIAVGPPVKTIGPFDSRPDLEAALLKRGVGFNDLLGD